VWRQRNVLYYMTCFILVLSCRLYYTYVQDILSLTHPFPIHICLFVCLCELDCENTLWSNQYGLFGEFTTCGMTCVPVSSHDLDFHWPSSWSFLRFVRFEVNLRNCSWSVWSIISLDYWCYLFVSFLFVCLFLFFMDIFNQLRLMDLG
jgi:hypothetical protein